MSASAHSGAGARDSHDLPTEDARNGAELLLDTLLECGVNVIFGYPGGAALPLYDALYTRPALRHILVRHEQAAVHAAEGYARSTGRVGVVLVTSGAGVSNTITGLLDAMSDSIPLLCISGQVSCAVIGTNAFQKSDALGMSRPVTKWNSQPRRAQDVAPAVRRALEIASSGRPGPVLLDVPKDVQLAAVGRVTPHRRALATSSLSARLPPSGSLQRAGDLLAAARRPVLYGGGGLINSGPEACGAFTTLANLLDAAVTLTLMGLGAFPASDRRFLGMLGMHGTLEANLAMHHADLVVAVGACFDDRVTGRLDRFCPQARKIHIAIDPSSIGKVVKVDAPLVGDCGAVVQSLVARTELQALPAGRLDAWWERIARWRSRDSLAYDDRDDVILPQRLMAAVQQCLHGRNAIVSTDVGCAALTAGRGSHVGESNRRCGRSRAVHHVGLEGSRANARARTCR